eukprot:sb/3465561/
MFSLSFVDRTVRVNEQARDLIDAERCSLFLLDEETDELYAKSFDVGSPSDKWKANIRTPSEKGLLGDTLKSGRVNNIEDTYSDSRFNNILASCFVLTCLAPRPHLSALFENQTRHGAAIQQEDLNIFGGLSRRDYKDVISILKHSIISTDLALYFDNRTRLRELQETNEYSNLPHPVYPQGLSYLRLEGFKVEQAGAPQGEAESSGDDMLFESGTDRNQPIRTRYSGHVTVYQPIRDQYLLIRSVPFLMRKVFKIFPRVQGDLERDLGHEPIPLMDKNKTEEQSAQCQVDFITSVCLPAYKLLSEFMPSTSPMYDGALTTVGPRFSDILGGKCFLVVVQSLNEMDNKRSNVMSLYIKEVTENSETLSETDFRSLTERALVICHYQRA